MGPEVAGEFLTIQTGKMMGDIVNCQVNSFRLTQAKSPLPKNP